MFWALLLLYVCDVGVSRCRLLSCGREQKPFLGSGITANIIYS